MLANTVTLIIDGERRVVVIKVGHIAEAERYFARQGFAATPEISGMLYAAWAACGKPDDFDAWALRVDDVEERAESGSNGRVPTAAASGSPAA